MYLSPNKYFDSLRIQLPDCHSYRQSAYSIFCKKEIYIFVFWVYFGGGGGGGLVVFCFCCFDAHKLYFLLMSDKPEKTVIGMTL